MDGNDKLLITLGIVFTQKFVESLGKDRGDVDFAITPDCHLCIFDTNPGGSGYANQFVSSATFNGVMKESLKLLNSITSITGTLPKKPVCSHLSQPSDT